MSSVRPSVRLTVVSPDSGHACARGGERGGDGDGDGDDDAFCTGLFAEGFETLISDRQEKAEKRAENPPLCGSCNRSVDEVCLSPGSFPVVPGSFPSPQPPQSLVLCVTCCCRFGQFRSPQLVPGLTSLSRCTEGAQSSACPVPRCSQHSVALSQCNGVVVVEKDLADVVEIMRAAEAAKKRQIEQVRRQRPLQTPLHTLHCARDQVARPESIRPTPKRNGVRLWNWRTSAPRAGHAVVPIPSHPDPPNTGQPRTAISNR